jgi:hypothetical protein
MFFLNLELWHFMRYSPDRRIVQTIVYFKIRYICLGFLSHQSTDGPVFQQLHGLPIVRCFRHLPADSKLLLTYISTYDDFIMCHAQVYSQQVFTNISLPAVR